MGEVVEEEARESGAAGTYLQESCAEKVIGFVANEETMKTFIEGPESFYESHHNRED